MNQTVFGMCLLKHLSFLPSTKMASIVENGSQQQNDLLYQLHLTSKNEYSRKKTNEFVIDQMNKLLNQHGENLMTSFQTLHQLTTYLKESWPEVPEKINEIKPQTSSSAGAISKVNFVVFEFLENEIYEMIGVFFRKRKKFEKNMCCLF